MHELMRLINIMALPPCACAGHGQHHAGQGNAGGDVQPPDNADEGVADDEHGKALCSQSFVVACWCACMHALNIMALPPCARAGHAHACIRRAGTKQRCFSSSIYNSNSSSIYSSNSSSIYSRNKLLDGSSNSIRETAAAYRQQQK
jgi:hypothetical protein